MEIGEPQRRHVIGRRQGYHGATAGALSVTGNLARRAAFEPLLLPVTHHIAPCFAYRDRKEGETEVEYGLRVADELEAEILRLGPDAVAAFVAETMVGSTLGCVPAVPGYFKRIRQICDRYGVLLILDEVMCGMGRTGTRYACEQEGITADFIAIAKGLSAGYLPLGAVLIADRIHAAIETGSNAVMHTHTYMGHPLSCAAALAVQQEIRERNLLANVRAMGQTLKDALADRFSNHPHVGDIRGRGLFLALELVADRDTKEPFDPALKLTSRILEGGMANGLICYPMGGVIDGRRGENVMLAPPFIIDETHVAEIVDKLGRTLDDVLHRC
jgi:adenosylmethionine-8-amino-7-oxononanoate aminotransferase